MLPDYDVEFDELPAIVEYPRTFVLSFVVYFAAVFLWYSSSFFVSSLFEKELSGFVTVVSGLIACLCIVFIFRYINSIVRSGVVRLRKNAVEFEQRDLFGTKRWIRDYAEFDGIITYCYLQRKQLQQYRVRLEHSDSKLSLELFRTHDEDLSRRVWERYANLLNLPTLQLRGGSIVSRKPDELDTPVYEQAAASSTRDLSELANSCPSGVKLTQYGKLITVTFNVPELPYIFPLVFVAMGIAFWSVGTATAAAPLLLGGLLFGVVGVGLLCFCLVARRKIHITQNEISFFRSGWDSLKVASPAMKLTDVEEINVRSQGVFRRLIEFVSDEFSHGISTTLSKQDLAWVREYCLAAMKKHKSKR